MSANSVKDIVIAAVHSGNFVLASKACIKIAQESGNDPEIWQMAAQLCNQAGLTDRAAQCYDICAQAYAKQSDIPQAISMMRHYADYLPDHQNDHVCRYLFHACRDGGIACALCKDQPDAVCQLFRVHDFWASFPDRLLAILLRSSPVRSYQAGDCIAREGDAAAAIHVITRGRVRPHFADLSDEHPVSSMGAGSVCGDIPFHLGLPYRVYSLFAEDDCELIEVPFELLRKLCAEHDDLQQWLRQQFNTHVLEFMLSNTPFFSRLTADVIGEVSRQMELTHVSAGHTVYRQGDCQNLDLFMVKSGWLSVHYQWKGREYHLCTLKPGDVFGQLGLIEKERVVTIRTITDVELMCWPEAVFRACFDKHYSLRDHAEASLARYRAVIDNIQAHERNPAIPLSQVNHDALLHGMFCARNVGDSSLNIV